MINRSKLDKPQEPKGQEAAMKEAEEFIREKFEESGRRQKPTDAEEKLDWLWKLREK